MGTLKIRAATIADGTAINEIYNHYIRHTTVTFDVDPWSAQRRREWMEQLTANPSHHLLVAESAVDERAIVGFAYNGTFRPRVAYRLSTETSIYAAPRHHAQGIGTALYQRLFQLIAQTDLHRAYAIIAQPNPHSIQFHQRFGFVQIGTLSQVGYKFGEYVDVSWFEKALK